jgi:Fe-Mn family superoxide dismutase
MAFTLPQLKYGFDALARAIDPQTMEIHHDKHHQAYVDNLNKALEAYPDLQAKSIEELVAKVNSLPEDIRNAVRNNGGGHWNHSFFWEILSPEPQDITKNDKVSRFINNSFGDFAKFQEEFKKAGLGRFGSGWVWLVKMHDGSLKIVSTPNQDNPLMDIADVKGTPVLGLDVWEHAYYLNYQNKRADYIDAFWDIVNWARVEELLG